MLLLQPYESVDDLVKAALGFQEANGLGNGESTTTSELRKGSALCSAVLLLAGPAGLYLS